MNYWIQLSAAHTNLEFVRQNKMKVIEPSGCLLQTLAALPDQDSFYDMVDGLEEQGMETVSQRHLGRKGTDLDLVEQLNIYEV